MVKIVIDTNVLFSGLFFGGTPKRILASALDGAHVVLLSEPMIDEYRRVIIGFENAKKHTKVFSDVLNLLIESATLVKPLATPKICRDPNDDMFIHCAVYGHADLIITGDNDLLVLKNVGPVAILTPDAFAKSFL